MHRDANLRKRNALVIPGTLLALYALVGMVYAVAVRSDDNSCGDGRLVEFAYACRDASLVLALPLLLGAVLVALGALMFRSTSTCRPGHGTVAWTTLVALGSFVALPWLAALGVYATEDTTAPYVITAGDAEFSLASVLAELGALGLLAFGPYLALFLARRQEPACCRQAQCFDPCFCDEPGSSAAAPPTTAAAMGWTAPESTPTPSTPAPESQAAPEAPMTPTAALGSPPTAAPQMTGFDQMAPRTAVKSPAPAASSLSKPTPKAPPAGRKVRTVRKTAAKRPAKKSA